MAESSNSETKPEGKKDDGAQPDVKNTATSTKSHSKTVSQDPPVRKAQRKVTKHGKSETVKVSARRVSPFLWMLALTNSILIIIMGLSGGYFWYTSSQTESQQLSLIQQNLASAKQSIASENRTTFDALKKQTEAQAANLMGAVDAKQSQLLEQMENLKTTVNEMGGDRTDAQIDSEVSYLVRMAERKMVIEQNVTQARYLLTEASTLLTQHAEPATIRLRELIAQDLNQLSVKELSNNDEILVQLNALATAVVTLPFAEPEQVFGEPQQTPSDDISDWRENIAITIENLRDAFINVDVLDEPLQPYMNLQQREIARGMLQYHILAARHAVLARNPKMYHATLRQTDGVLDVFDQNSAQYSVIKQQVDALLRQPVNQEVLFSLSSYQHLRGKDQPDQSEPEVESQL